MRISDWSSDVCSSDLVAGGGAHRETGDEAALQQAVRVVAQDLAVLAGARLRLVGVDHQVGRAVAAVLRHEGPLEAGREAGAAAPAQAGVLDLLDDRVAAEFEQRLGVVPHAAPPGAGKADRKSTRLNSRH